MKLERVRKSQLVEWARAGKKIRYNGRLHTFEGSGTTFCIEITKKKKISPGFYQIFTLSRHWFQHKGKGVYQLENADKLS